MTGHWHRLLLAFAGTTDDAALAAARTALAAASELAASDDSVTAAAVPVEIERAVTTGADGTSLTGDELAAVAFLARDVGAAAAADALAHYGLRAPAYEWAPLPGGSTLAGSDPAGGSDRAASDPAVVVAGTEAIVTALRDEPGVRGIWGVLRTGVDTGDVRVFLVEVADPADLASVTATAQARLVEVGEDPPRVEVFGADTALPAYHRAALAGATLLWAASAADPELVPVFDGVDDAGRPIFADDRPSLDAAERESVAGYLYGADAVLLTTATMADVVDPELGEVVPLTYRTDGRFVWPDASAYYAQRHGIAPYPPLLAAIRAADYRPPRTDLASRMRAEQALFAEAPA
ncbi:hypothetical protein O7623_28230 [Solwaraspora sp. WMMD791]|uniref:hypothetical protein n=1 Tax=Solwaraspora sp. WMMD791 TaxID=3016086 RepID=UPI00249A35B7|nr:hypothetical protein [Solwaraspora sp. WMMD791]WFE27094.1 hypothetical protein O7623_28230 [Solwaraspora sp. WMMD791]